MSSGKLCLNRCSHDRDVGEALALLGHALDLEAAVDPLEVVRVGLQQVRGASQRLGLDLRGGALDGAGEHHGRAGAAGPGRGQPVLLPW